MDVNGCPGTLNEVRFLEHIQCKISLRFFPRGNLRVDLTSPMGTTSTLLFERPRDVVSSNFDDWPFLSVHFWGEKAEGRWTLRIHNNGNRHVNQAGMRRTLHPQPQVLYLFFFLRSWCSENICDFCSSRSGILKRWQLIFYGTSTNPIRLKNVQSSPQSVPPFAIPQPQARSGNFPFSNAYIPSGGGSISDILSQPSFRNVPDIFASGSEPEVTYNCNRFVGGWRV